MNNNTTTDWFAVITEINRYGITVAHISAHIHIPRTTILGWKQGAEPKHSDGEKLVGIWQSLTGKSRENLPQVGPGDWQSYHSGHVRQS